MIGIVERLRFDATRCELQFSKGVAGNINEGADEIERLGKDLAEAVRLLDGLLGLERGSGAAALLFVENHPPLLKNET